MKSPRGPLNPWTNKRIIVIVAMLLFMVLVVGIAYLWFVGYEIKYAGGSDSKNAIGDATSRDGLPCYHKDSDAVPGSGGYIAIVRFSSCEIGWGDEEQYYVFMHSQKVANAEGNLVFSFVPGVENSSTISVPRPRVSWLTRNTIAIAVTDSDFSIVKQWNAFQGIQIYYRFEPRIDRK
jgi:hypothetical protein